MPTGAGQLGGFFIDVGMDVHPFKRDLKNVNRKFTRTLDSMQRRAKKFATSMTRIWHVAIVGLGAFSVAAGTAVNSFMNLEDAQVELAKRLDTSIDGLSGLYKQLTQLSTQLPTTRQELTEVATAAARVGIAEQNLLPFVNTMKRFEIATDMAADEAALAFGRLINVTDLTVDTVDNLGSALAKLVDEFPTKDVQGIMQVMTKLGRTLGAAMKIPAEDIAGLAALVSSMAQRVARPASQLRKLFVEMMTYPQRFADAARIDMERFTDAIRESPITALQLFLKNLHQVTGGGEDLVKMFASISSMSQTAIKAIAPLASRTSLLAKAVGMSREEFKSATRLQEEFRKEMEKLRSQIRITTGNLGSLWQTVGQSLEPAVRNFNDNILKPLSARLLAVATGGDKAEKAMRDFILTGLKVTGLVTLFGALAKAVAFFLGPVGSAIALASLFYFAWKYNIGSVREALEGLGEAFGELMEGDIVQFGEKLTQTFKDNPIPTALTLAVSGFTIARFMGASVLGMIGGALTMTGVFSGGATAGMVVLAKGLALSIAIPLAISEFAPANVEEWKSKLEDSSFVSKVRATVQSFPVTVTLGMIYGGMSWSKWAVPAMSGITTLIANHIPWLYLKGAALGYAVKGITGPMIAIAGVNIVLGIITAQLAWNKFRVTGEGIIDEVIGGLLSVFSGTALAIGAGTVLGVSTGSAIAIGLTGAALVLAITQLIPDIKLGGKTSDELNKEVDKAKESLQKQVETTFGIEINLEPSMVRKNLGKVEEELEKAISNINDLTEKQLENLRKTLNKISKLAEKPSIVLPSSLVSTARKLDQLLEQQGYSQGGPVGFQEGGQAGFVPGTGSGDIIPAMLEPGEFVWPKEMVQRFPGLIKGMWQGFKKGGSVSSGKHYYGPGPDSSDDSFTRMQKIFDRLYNNVESLGKRIEKWVPEENLEKFRKDWQGFTGLFKELRDVDIDDALNLQELRQNADDIRDSFDGVTTKAELLQASLGELKEQIREIDVTSVGKIATIFKGITTKKVPETMAAPPGSIGPPQTFKDIARDPTLKVLDTLAKFDTSLGDVVERLFQLEKKAKEYGFSTEFVDQGLQQLRKNLKGANFPLPVFNKRVEEARKAVYESTQALYSFSDALKQTKDKLKKARKQLSAAGLDIPKMGGKIGERLTRLNAGLQGAETLISIANKFQDKTGQIPQVLQDAIDKIRETNLGGRLTDEATDDLLESLIENQTAFDKLAEKVGIASDKLRNMISSTLSALSSLASRTGTLSEAQSTLIDGMTSAAESAMRGNWFQAGLDLLTGFIGSWIEKLKAKRDKLQKQLDATYQIIDDSLNELGSLISNLVGGLLGPFDSALSGALDAIVSFSQMIQEGGGTVEGTQSAFQALLSIATGVADSFIGLLQRSKQWEALQNEINPLWDALANAMGELLYPVIALVKWLREYLGISKDVGEELAEVTDLNVAEGFKRARTRWETSTPGMGPTGGGDTGVKIPTWAKEMIQPIKEALIPILNDLKSISLSEKLRQIANSIVNFVAKKIPKAWNWLQSIWIWLNNNASSIWNTIRKKATEIYNWFKDNFKGNFSDAMDNLKNWTPSDLEDKLDDINTMLRNIGNALVNVIAAAAGAIVGGLSGILLPFVGVWAGAAGGAAAGWLLGNMANVPKLQEGGSVIETGLAQVHKGETVIPPKNQMAPSSFATGGAIILKNELNLDGRIVYENQQKYKEKDLYTSKGSTTGSGFARS